MGAGKTSVGRIVAEQLHFDYLDTDDLIQVAHRPDHRGDFQDRRRAGLPRARTAGRRRTGQPHEDRHRHRRRAAGQSGQSRQPQDPRPGRLPVGLAGENLGTRQKPDPPSPAPRPRPAEKNPRPPRRARTILQAGRRAGEHGHPVRARSRPAGGPSVPPGGLQPAMKAAIRQRAMELGFDDCRFTTAAAPAGAGQFRKWIAGEHAGEMTWLERNGARSGSTRNACCPGPKA